MSNFMRQSWPEISFFEAHSFVSSPTYYKLDLLLLLKVPRSAAYFVPYFLHHTIHRLTRMKRDLFLVTLSPDLLG